MVNPNAPDATRAKIRKANKSMDTMADALGRAFHQRNPPPPPPPGPRVPGRYSRDNQRGRVYDAEKRLRRVLDRQHEYPIASVAGSRIVLPLERKFARIEDVQTYVDRALALGWPEYPRLAAQQVPVVAQAEHLPQNAAWYTGGRLILPVLATNPATGTRWAMRELVVLHELAHHALAVHDGTARGHGPEFVAAFRTLSVRMMGPEMALLFDVIFHDAGVKLAS